MLSSRERRPTTAGNNNRNSARSQLSNSARARPRTSERSYTCTKTTAQLNDPLLVNRKFDIMARGKSGGNDALPPTLNMNNERYPTIHPRENLEARMSRPLSCPEEFVTSNLNPSWEENPNYRPQVNNHTKILASQHFIEKNYEYMHEYRPEYRNKTPRSLHQALVHDKSFCSTMKELKKKECSVRNGTSSHHIQTILQHPGNTHHDHESHTRHDPYMASTNTSREHREDKMNRLFMPSTRNMSHVKTFNRGYKHDKEFKNFSEFNGHLIRNKGTMLER